MENALLYLVAQVVKKHLLILKMTLNVILAKNKDLTMKTNELVINWHITEVCNFKCRYCFAHWNKACKRELLHFNDKVEELLTQLAQLTNVFAKQGVFFDSTRLNLVGGETFLYQKQVKHIIKIAHGLDLKLSAITNGSMLDDEIIMLIGKYFDGIGFSVDSIHDKTNLLIGRQTKGNAMKTQKILSDIHNIRKINPKINIKINTVVNDLNYQENLSNFIEKVNPNKWKIFKMLPVITNDLSITDNQFDTFLNNHRHLSDIISSEDNDEMTQSYLMIDPFGRFFQNGIETNNVYQYSEPILDVGIEKAFHSIDFSLEKFNQRY